MAITNAQQYKQLLEQGGRVGLQGGGADMGTKAGDTRAARDNREIGARMARTAASGQGDAMRRNQQAFQTAVGVGDLDRLQKEGVPDVNLGLSSIILNSPPAKKFRNFGLRKNIERYKKLNEGPYTLQGYKDYMKSMRDRFTSDDNESNNMLLPITPYQQDIVAQEPEEELSELQQMLADRGPLARRFAADGGIMNPNLVGGMMDGGLDEMGRQMYGLGKLVKKATRAVKKIAKSPIGKAALAYGITGGLGNLASGQGFFTNFMSPTKFLANTGSIFSREGLRNIAFGRPESIISPGGKDIFRQAATKGIFGSGGEFSPLKAITAASVLPLLGIGTGDESEEEAQVILDQSGIDIADIRANPKKYQAMRFMAEGGSTEKEPVAKKTMPLLDMDGMEKDYRAEGGFVPIGRMEKADDVPARLSKNEFVFTADAVRNAGDGDVDKGAEVMYNMMKNLEAGGDVSEESQGLDGARKMFQTSQRLEEVL